VTVTILDENVKVVENQFQRTYLTMGFDETTSQKLASELVSKKGANKAWHIQVIYRAFLATFVKGTFVFQKFHGMGQTNLLSFLSSTENRGKKLLVFGTLRNKFERDGTIEYHKQGPDQHVITNDSEYEQELEDGEWGHVIGLVTDKSNFTNSYFFCSMFPKTKMNVALLQLFPYSGTYTVIIQIYGPSF